MKRVPRVVMVCTVTTCATQWWASGNQSTRRAVRRAQAAGWTYTQAEGIRCPEHGAVS